MQLDIHGHNTAIKPATREHVEKKAQRLARVAHHIERIELKLTEDGTEFRVDLVVHADRGTFKAQARGESVRALVDDTMDKVERQILKKHDKKVAQRNEPDQEPASSGVAEE